MATVQQSIDIKVPVHTVYNQLTQFEDYPRFMEEVEAVQQLDDTHLHWKTTMANRPVEWDAEIIEQQPDNCIAWRNVSGPTNAGKVEVQAVGQDASRIIFTLQTEPEQVPGSMAGTSEQEMALKLKLDLARLKDFIEARGSETGAWRGEVDGAQVSGESVQPERGSPRNSPVPTSAYAAGSEGFAGDEEPSAPVQSTTRTAAEQRNDSAGSVARSAAGSAGGVQPNQTAQPPMRHVGQMPQDTSGEVHGGAPTSDAMGKSTQQPGPQQASTPAQPERAQQPAAGTTAAAVGAAGGTDAAAGARMAGGPVSSSAPAEKSAGTAGAPGGGTAGPSAAAGAAAAGGTVLGNADMGADAGDTRSVPRAGTAGAASNTDAARGTGPQGTKP